MRRPVSSAGRLEPVELAARKLPTQHEPSCRLAVQLKNVPQQMGSIMAAAGSESGTCRQRRLRRG